MGAKVIFGIGNLALGGIWNWEFGISNWELGGVSIDQLISWEGDKLIG